MSSLTATLAHHDRELGSLANRMGHVEKTLGEHGSILHEIRQAVTKHDAQPRVDVHRAVSTVVALAVLFSMVCGGIIWITTSQFSGIVAEQRSLNTELKSRTEKHDLMLDKLSERVGWTASTKRAAP